MEVRVERLNIKHDQKERRFYFTEKDARDAELKYKLHTEGAPNVMEFTSTYVPSAIRNNGLASELVHEGINFAKDQGYKVKPTCSFVENYINERPSLKELVA
jgi:predicted GNAT family acetyltransferase